MRKVLILVFLMMLFISINLAAANFTVSLIDSYGDGWNGGSLDVLVNDTPVLSGITLSSGAGPVDYTFPVENGDMISTIYSAGSFSYENEYYIYDNIGSLIASDGVSGTPTGLDQFPAVVFEALTCYDIQYTEDQSGDSPLYGDDVVVLGIVTGTDFYVSGSNRFFIQDPEGGPWSGLFVFDNASTWGLSLGDIVLVSATVDEYYGFTELTSVTDVTVLSTGNELPEPQQLISGEVGQEQWEGVLVELNNVVVTASEDGNNQWYVDDGLLRSPCQIDDGFTPVYNDGTLDPQVGDKYSSITGIVDYSYSEFGVNPRTMDDLEIYTIIAEDVEGFESATCPPDGWTIVYADGNPNVNTMTHSTSYPYTGNQSFRFSSMSSTSDYTQYLISPQLISGSRDQISFWYRRYSYGAENFKVGFSTTDNDVASFTWSEVISDATTTYQQYVEDVPLGANYVAIQYCSNYQYYLYIDDFALPAPIFDYAVEVTADESTFYTSESGPVDLIVTIHNTGLESDTYNLSIGNANWPVTIYDQDGISEISEIAVSGLQYDVIVRVDVPESTRMDSDEFTFTATSQNDGAVSASIDLSANKYYPVTGTTELFNFEDGLDQYIYYYGDNAGLSSDVAIGENSFKLGSEGTEADGLNWAKYTFEIPAVLEHDLFLDFNLNLGEPSRNPSCQVALLNEDGTDIIYQIIDEGWYHSEGEWFPVPLNITPLAGETFTLYFEVNSEAGNPQVMYIDDLKLHYPVPTLIMDPVAINFGELQVGDVGEAQFTISNPGSAPEDLVITSINSTSPFLTYDQTRDFVISPGGSETFNVTFEITELGQLEESLIISSNDPFTLPPFANGAEFAVSAIGIPPEPEMVLNTYSRAMNVGYGLESSYTYDIEIENTGLAQLNIGIDVPELSTRGFSLSADTLEIPALSTGILTLNYIPEIDTFMTEEFTLEFNTNDEDNPTASIDVFANTIGTYGTEPDGFGYLCRNSLHEDGPTYVWRDVRENMVTSDDFTSADDGYLENLPIGFDFTFYDSVYSQFNLNANGLLYFVPYDDRIPEDENEMISSFSESNKNPKGRPWYSNTYIPNASNPNGMIAFYWDDLHLGYTEYNTRIYYGNDGDGSLVVTYEDMPRLGTSSGGYGTITFQIVLTPGGDILLQYKEVDWTRWSSSNQNSATIGIESPDGSAGSQYSYNYPSICSEMAIRYYTPWDETATLPDEINMEEDTTFLLDILNYVPSGGQALDIQITSDPANVDVQIVDNQFFQFTPDADWNGTDEMGYDITLAARDGSIIRAAGTIEINVTPVNDVPIVENPIGDLDLMEDFGTYSLSLTGVFYDPDNELEYTIEVSDLSKVDVDLNEGQIDFTSIQDMYTLKPGVIDNPIQITVTASEVSGIRSNGLITVNANSRANATTSFNVSIEQVNDVPVVANPVADLAIDEDNSAAIDLSNVFLDVDDDPMTYDFELEGGTHLTAEINEFNVLTLTPEADWSGVETITISADDGVNTRSTNRMNRISVNSSREMVEDTFILTVNPVNDAPIVVNPIGTVVMPEDGVDTSINLNDVFSDADSGYDDFLTFTEASNANIDVAIDAGIVTLEPVADWNGLVVVTFTATDVEGAFITDQVTVTVTPVNDPPTIQLPAEFTFNEGGTLTRNFSQYVNDVDGDPLELSVNGNEFVTVGISGLTVTFGTVDPLDFGQETLTFTIDDGHEATLFSTGSRDTATDNVEIIVNYVNHAPEYNGPNYINLDEDFEEYTIGDLDELFTDVDPEEFTDLTFNVVSYNETKIIPNYDTETHVLTIEPVEHANGLSTLRISANDNDSYSGRAALTTIRDIQIDINPVNDAPVFVELPEFIEMAANSYQFIDLGNSFEDVDDATPLMEITSPEGFITATKLEGYNYRFRLSSLGVYGEDGYITVTVDDGHDRAVATADIFVTVAESEPPYVVYNIPNQEFDEDFELTEIADLDECFADPDNPTLNYDVEVLTTVDDNPVFEAEITEGENVLYVGSAVPDWNGFAEVRVDAWDVQNRITVSQTIGFNILPVNDLPVATDIPDVTLDEDFGMYPVVDLETIFTDVDGEELTFDVEGGDGVVVPDLNGTELILNSIPDAFGLVQITAKAHDNTIYWVETSFMVLIEDIFDPPTFNPTLAGMTIPVATEGELLNFENLNDSCYVETYGQTNTVPIAFELIGDTPYYDVTVSEDFLFGIEVVPIGYQWGYPNQDIKLTLVDENGGAGDEVIVTLMTNFSPYILQPIPDILVMSGDMFMINPNIYFADPEGEDLYYNVIYDFDYISMSSGMGYFTFNALPVGDTTYTNITIVASDVGNRATAAQTFTVTIISGESAASFDEIVNVESGEEVRIALNKDINIGMNSKYQLQDNAETARIEGNELVVNYTTDVAVRENIQITVPIDEGMFRIQNFTINVEPKSDDTPVYVTALGENYPNPFNPTTVISFSLAEAGNVEISIYNARGQFVKTVKQGYMDAGKYQAVWNGTDSNGNSVSSGIYFYRMKSDDNEEMRKMILMK